MTKHYNILASKERYTPLSINCMLDSISQKKSEIKVAGHWQDSEFTTAFPEKLISVGKRAHQAR